MCENIQGRIFPSWKVAAEVESHHHTHDDLIDGDVLQRIQAYDYYILTNIPLSDLSLDEWEVDEGLVDEYVSKLQNGEEYPPIVIDSISYGVPTIIDGIHRANALSITGNDTVKAYVTKE